MKQSYLIVIVVVLGILGVGGFLLFQNQQTSTTLKETPSNSVTTDDFNGRRDIFED